MPAQSAPQAGMTIFGGLPTESHFRSRGERAVAPASGCSQGEWSCQLQTRLAGFRPVRLIKVHDFKGHVDPFEGRRQHGMSAWRERLFITL